MKYDGDIVACAVDEAFREMLAGNNPAAAAALARAQREQYGLKAWRFGLPSYDALAQLIVYVEDGGRYTVHEIQPNGAHVRLDLGHMRYIGPISGFAARGPEAKDAALAARKFVTNRQIREVRHTSSRVLASGWVEISYHYGRAPLD